MIRINIKGTKSTLNHIQHSGLNHSALSKNHSVLSKIEHSFFPLKVNGERRLSSLSKIEHSLWSEPRSHSEGVSRIQVLAYNNFLQLIRGRYLLKGNFLPLLKTNFTTRLYKTVLGVTTCGLLIYNTRPLRIYS